MPNLTKISPVNPEKILLKFDTNEEFIVSSLDLRFECPCASCVDEITGKRTLKRETLRADVRPTKIEPVGRYGIHVDWSDGHRTGMYHFDTLYAIANQNR